MQGITTRQISEPFSHQFSNHFKHFRIHPRMAAEYALNANQYIADSSPFFHGFLLHMVSYTKFILMAVDG